MILGLEELSLLLLLEEEKAASKENHESSVEGVVDVVVVVVVVVVSCCICDASDDVGNDNRFKAIVFTRSHALDISKYRWSIYFSFANFFLDFGSEFGSGRRSDFVNFASNIEFTLEFPPYSIAMI